MTDYLGRLAARSLDAGKVIQPRLPGLFEHTTNGQFMERSTAFEEMEVPQLNRAENAAETVPASEVHGLKKMAEEPTTEIAPDLKPPVERRYLNLEERIEQDKPPQKAAKIGSKQLEAHVHQRQHRIDISVLPRQDRDVKEKMGSLITPSSAEHPARPQAFDISSEPMLHGPPKSSPAGALYRGPLSEVQNRSISTNNPMPTIKVNIGRIEVRAVAQPLPQKEVSTKTPPKLSLEEYSKQRRGGRA